MDNDSIPIAERQRIYDEYKHKPEGAARLYGEYFHRSGLIYKGLRENIHLIDPFPIPSNWPILSGIDPHNRKPSACVWAAISPKGNIYIIDELNDEEDYLLEEFTSRVLEKDRGRRIVRRLIDPSSHQRNSQTGVTMKDYLKNLGLKTKDATNDLTIGYDSVRKRIMSDAGPSIYFFKDCAPKTWKQMSNLVYAEFRFRSDQDPKEVQKKRQDDLADCVRYICAERYQYEDDSIASMVGSVHTGSTGWRDTVQRGSVVIAT